MLFATAPELLAMVRDGFNAGQAEDLMEACQRVSFDPAQDKPWLVVDDLGAERLTDRAAEASARAQPSGFHTSRAWLANGLEQSAKSAATATVLSPHRLSETATASTSVLSSSVRAQTRSEARNAASCSWAFFSSFISTTKSRRGRKKGV